MLRSESYILTVNDDFKFSLSSDISVDFVQLEEGRFHILKDNQSFQAEVIDANWTNKTIHIKVNGNKYKVDIADKYDQLVQQLGLSTVNNQQVRDIKAPMPGLVLSINVKEGEQVTEGQSLLILEAMKMENVLKSPGEGIIKTIHVEKGTAVDKGLLLIEMEPV